MKKIFLPLVVGLTAIGTANAVDLRQYVSLKITDVISGNINVDYDDGVYAFDEDYKAKEFFGGSFAYGVKLSDFRVELEGNAYSRAKFKKLPDVSAKTTSLFANGYYDIQTNSLFTPYVTVGLGYSRISVDGDSDASLGLKAGIGVAWEINDNFALDVGYRYNDFGTYSEEFVDASLSGHELSLGARVSF